MGGERARRGGCDDLGVRLFVALTPPPAVVDELWAVTEVLRAEHPELRWVMPGQCHLTLAFLGEVDDDTQPGLGARLARAAGRTPPLTLSLGGGGRFGEQVLWTRVRGETDRLRHLAASVRAAARRCRLPVDDRPYRPHLTLARNRNRAEPGVVRSAATSLDDFDGLSWTADEVHLVRSYLGGGPGGTARHDRLASWPLGRA